MLSSDQLKLAPFTLADLCKSIVFCQHDGQMSHLLEEIHIAYIKFIAKERRAMDGKINFHNHNLFLDNTHLAVPPFTPEEFTIPESLPFDCTNDIAGDHIDGDTFLFDNEPFEEEQQQPRVKIARSTAAASKEAIARMIGLSSSEDDDTSSEFEVIGENLVESGIKIKDEDAVSTEVKAEGLSSLDQPRLFATDAESRRRSSRAKDFSQNRKVKSQRVKREIKHEEEISVDDVPQADSRCLHNAPLVVQGAWFVNQPTAANWCYLLMMMLREVCFNPK
jgi:hypothetical protein